jgi:hypothetical protein
VDQGVELCGRCANAVAPKDLEFCWFCQGPLCYDCWEDIGVCGCPGSDQAQEDIRSAKTHSERAEIMMRPGLIGATRNRRQFH